MLQLREAGEEIGSMKKSIEIYKVEKEKMKQKIIKLKRRRNIDFNQKTCKTCGNDFIESENFNWSCRVHRVFKNCLNYIV